MVLFAIFVGIEMKPHELSRLGVGDGTKVEGGGKTEEPACQKEKGHVVCIGKKRGGICKFD